MADLDLLKAMAKSLGELSGLVSASIAKKMENSGPKTYMEALIQDRKEVQSNKGNHLFIQCSFVKSI